MSANQVVILTTSGSCSVLLITRYGQLTTFSGNFVNFKVEKHAMFKRLKIHFENRQQDAVKAICFQKTWNYWGYLPIVFQTHSCISFLFEYLYDSKCNVVDVTSQISLFHKLLTTGDQDGFSENFEMRASSEPNWLCETKGIFFQDPPIDRKLSIYENLKNAMAEGVTSQI